MHVHYLDLIKKIYKKRVLLNRNCTYWSGRESVINLTVKCSNLPWLNTPKFSARRSFELIGARISHYRVM